MSSQEYYEKIGQWNKQDVFTRTAILDTLGDRIKTFNISEEEEELQLHHMFHSLSTSKNGTRYLSQPAFFSFLQ